MVWGDFLVGLFLLVSGVSFFKGSFWFSFPKALGDFFKNTLGLWAAKIKPQFSHLYILGSKPPPFLVGPYCKR